MRQHIIRSAVAVALASLVFVQLASARSDRQASATATAVQVKGGEFFYRLSTKSIAKPGTVTFVFKNVGHVLRLRRVAGSCARSAPQRLHDRLSD
jgi:hypothetical protein